MSTPTTPVRNRLMKRTEAISPISHHIYTLELLQNLNMTTGQSPKRQTYLPMDVKDVFEIGIGLIVKKESGSHDYNPRWALVLSETDHTFETSKTASVYTIQRERPGVDTFKQEYTRSVNLVHTETSVKEKSRLAAIYRLGFVPTKDVSRERLSEFLVMFSPHDMDDTPIKTGMNIWSTAAYVLRLMYYLRMGKAQREDAEEPAPSFRLEVDKTGKPVLESSILPKPIDLISQHHFKDEKELYDQITNDWNRRVATTQPGHRMDLYRIEKHN